jgi:methyl-accepting chemotaxis protein
MQLSVQARLAGGFAVLLALMGVLVAIAVVSVNRLQEAQHEVAGSAVPYLQGLSDAALAAKSAANDERGYLMTGDQKYATEAVGRREAEKAGLAQARAAAANQAEASAVDAVDAALTNFNTALDAEFRQAATDRDAAMQVSVGPNRDLRKKYETAFADAIELAKADVATTTADNDALARTIRTLLIVALVVMAGLGVTIAVLLGRSIVRSLRAAIVVLEAGAAGDLTRRAQVRGAVEFRRMAEATNHMLAATADAVRSLALNSADLVTTAREMTATSDAVASSAEVATAKAGQVSANAGDVSDGVRTVSVAAEEMTATINEIASSVSQAAGVSAGAVTSAEDAGAAVRQLDASSRQIGTVVQLITSIAEQTNLLALNATIEAARAGDAGKGFAVVAGEVKDLAQETAKATGEIANQVAAIQGDTQRAVDAIGRISEVIGSISQYQNTIATAVEEQSATTNEMGRSISEIASRTEQITTGIADVAGTVGSTATTIETSRRSAAALSAMAGDLQDLVARFRYQ